MRRSSHHWSALVELAGNSPLDVESVGLGADGDTLSGHDGRRVVNQQETLAAQEKAEALQRRSVEWLWSDAERAERLATYYNDTFTLCVRGSTTARRGAGIRRL